MNRVWAAIKRVLPRRLASQIIVLLMLALVASQAVTLAFFLYERREAVREVTREQVLRRVASVVRLLDETPPALHRRVVRGANAPLLRFWMSPSGAIRHSTNGGMLRHRLEDMLEGSSASEIRVDVSGQANLYGESQPRFGWPERRPPQRRPEGGERHDDWDDDWDEDDHDDHDGEDLFEPGLTPQLVGLTISIRLAEGGWLNAQSALPVSNSLWALPSLMSTAIMAAALIVIVVLTVRRITRPMDNLAAAAGRLGRGESVADVPEQGPLDVRNAIRAFNAMNQRLDRFVRDRTGMLAAISHDLRTPITVLRLRAEFVEDAEARRKILETLDEMEQMAEATLAFAREEATREPTRAVDLSALVDSVCDDLAELGRDVTFAEADKLPFACRPVALKRAVRNLVENAVTYGERARVSMEKQEADICVVIEDDGPGIPDEDQETVFQPFVRLEESRSQETGGIGLGMAIARSIVRGHGGDIDLENREEGGLRAVMRLPKPDQG